MNGSRIDKIAEAWRSVVFLGGGNLFGSNLPGDVAEQIISKSINSFSSTFSSIKQRLPLLLIRVLWETEPVEGMYVSVCVCVYVFVCVCTESVIFQEWIYIIMEANKSKILAGRLIGWRPREELTFHIKSRANLGANSLFLRRALPLSS